VERSYSLGEFARQNDIGLTTVRGEIKAGLLAARKVGRRTIITAEDAKAWQQTVAKSAAASSRARLGAVKDGSNASGCVRVSTATPAGHVQICADGFLTADEAAWLVDAICPLSEPVGLEAAA